MSVAPRTWPPGLVIAAENRVGATCAACDADWIVHRRLAGFRFSCGACGVWVQVGVTPDAVPLELAPSASLEVRGSGELARVAGAEGGIDGALRPVEEMPRDADGRVLVDLPLGRLYEGRIPTNLPLAPGALRHAEVEARRSWTNRTLVEIGAMFTALVAPHVALLLMAERDAARLSPLASLVGGLLVVLIGMSAPHYTFKGMRPARPRFFFEGALVCALFVGAAIGWTSVVDGATGVREMMEGEWGELRELLGTPLLLAVLAIAPALFEELAFRGLLQGRLSALLGKTTGIGVTAAFFALAHGISWASPVHVAAGAYLGILRDRSGSLLPGMLLHFGYNATLVLFYASGG